MRPPSEVEMALDLSARGLSTYEIARRTGVPSSTVWNWVAYPDRALARRARNSSQVETDLGRPWGRGRERAYSYLLGMYLGDGHIVRARRSERLSIYCDDAYPGIVEEVGTAIERVLSGTSVWTRDKGGSIESASCSVHWPCYFPQHGPGRKHERPIVLAHWQREIVERHPRPLLRGLIHSDDWRGMNVAIQHTDLAIEYRTYTRYQFTNRSADIRGIFCDACDLLGVRWTQMNRWTISVARRKDVHYLDSFVGPKR